MKKAFAIFLFSFTLVATHAQQSAADPLQVAEAEYNFGAVPQGKPVYHDFVVRNTGSKPLVLTDVHASCGCTTPEWKKDPVAPGSTATIKVGFNAASEGNFNKSITIQYNESLQKQLLISGNVWRAPEGAAPPNAAVQFLKQQLQ